MIPLLFTPHCSLSAILLISTSSLSLLYIIIRTFSYRSRRMQLTEHESVSPNIVNSDAELSDHADASFQISFGRYLFDASSSIKFSQYYFANGAHADLWQGHIGGRTFAVKVWRGVSLPLENRKSLDMVGDLLVAVLHC